MLAQIHTLTLSGLTALSVDIEVDLHRGLPSFQVVGLADTAIQEARERVRSALKNAGYEFPRMKIAVNLAPASLKKSGPRFDLPIALGVLAASGQVDVGDMSKSVVLGELSFTGEVRGVSGVLPTASAARDMGMRHLFVPAENAAEAALIEGIEVFPVAHLQDLVGHFQGILIEPQAHDTMDMLHAPMADEYDFMHVKGQEHAKRALEIAAAGGHNMLMTGPPGSGKTMLAKAFRTILPRLTIPEALEITKVHSIAGLTSANEPVLRRRPFRAVHHTASGVAIVGGGNPPKPGEISLSHRGVLFLDEFAEFSQKTLEVLRQPLEDGVITVSRASGSVQFPAQFMLVAAMNPTPSGYDEHDPRCADTAFAIQRYKNKVSGPILDRIDLHVRVPHIPFEKLSQLETGESSQDIRDRVEAARVVQSARFSTNKGTSSNAEMSSPMVKKHCVVADEAQMLLKSAVQQMGLSGRSYYRVLKLARTIADLDESEDLKTVHIAEAIGYRDQGRTA